MADMFGVYSDDPQINGYSVLQIFRNLIDSEADKEVTNNAGMTPLEAI